MSGDVCSLKLRKRDQPPDFCRKLAFTGVFQANETCGLERGGFSGHACWIFTFVQYSEEDAVGV